MLAFRSMKEKKQTKRNDVHIRLTLINPAPPIRFRVLLPCLNPGLAQLRIPIVRVTRLIALTFVIKHLDLVQPHFERLGCGFKESATAVEHLNFRAFQFAVQKKCKEVR